MTPTLGQIAQWARAAGMEQDGSVFFSSNREESDVNDEHLQRFAEIAIAEGTEQVLNKLSQALWRAGATLPAPQPTGTIAGAMNTGLCIALAQVEFEAEAIRAFAPKAPEVPA